MQNVKFDSVEEFFNYLPDNERKIVDLLRQVILDCIPDCTEKLSYNVPYYYRHYRICFIWPSSVPWGNVKVDDVQLGFCNGNLLNDNINFLERGDRKQVNIKTFHDVKEIDIDLVRAYVYDAVNVDEQLRKGEQESLRK